MAEKVDAWMPLHVGPYLAATRHLAAAEHGMYLLLLMHAWNNGGVIPGDDNRMRQAAGATPSEWKKARGAILDFLTKQEDGTYRQKRLDAELTKSMGLKAERSVAGAQGARNRWQSYGKAMATPIANDKANECPVPRTFTEEPTSPPSPPPGGVSVDNPEKSASKNTRWWLSQAGILAEGQRVGLTPKSGESFSAYAQRIREVRV